MRIQTILACAALTAVVTGCKKSDTASTDMTTASTTVTTNMPSTQPSMMDQAKSSASSAMDTMKDKGSDAGSSMSSMKDSAMSSASSAGDTMSATAQKYYDQAKSYMSSGNTSGASDTVSKLDAMKGSLSQEWQTKISELDAMLSKAKNGAGNMMSSPTTMP